MPSPVMEDISVPYVATTATPHAAVLETNPEYILYKNVTPYNPKAWHLALQHADLLHLFPNLVHNLTYGSPIAILLHYHIPSFLINWAQPTLTQPTWILSWQRKLILAAWMALLQLIMPTRYSMAISGQHPSALLRSQVQQHCV